MKKFLDAGRNPRTLECMKICPKCGQAKDPTSFYKDLSKHDGLQKYCKPCSNDMNARVGKDGLTSMERWRLKNPGKQRGYLLKHNYGLTSEQFDSMLNEQGGACAICRDTNKKWCVDHNHATGAVRAILCYCCNIAIGNLGDSARLAQAATDYLTKHGNP